MAVTKVGYHPDFIGLAADSKPTGVPVGSQFLAYDTGVLYTTYDGTNWAATNSLPAGTNSIGATKDNGAAWTTLHKVVNSADMSGAGIAKVIDDPAAGLKFVLTDIIISTDTAMNVTLKEETGGAVLGGPYYLPANGTIQITPRSKWIKTTVATDAIQALASVAGNITVETFGFVEA